MVCATIVAVHAHWTSQDIPMHTLTIYGRFRLHVGQQAALLRHIQGLDGGQLPIESAK
jgi:hypothetical protein